MASLMVAPTEFDTTPATGNAFFERIIDFTDPNSAQPTAFSLYVKATQKGVIESGFYTDSDLRNHAFSNTLMTDAPDWFRTLEGKLDAYLSGQRVDFSDVPIDWDYIETHYKSVFHKTLWKTLFRVPYGKTVTYGQLAEQAGSPKAARAVGQGMRANPIPLIIPCHRVVSSSKALNNGLGGFMGHRDGFCIDIKAVLLNKEGHTWFN